MTRRLVLSYLAVTLIVLVVLEVPLGIFFSQRERSRLEWGVERDARVLATIYEDDLEAGTPLDPSVAERYATRTGARVVAVDARGLSALDTDQSTPRDFSTRPEIATALAGGQATGTRASATLDTTLLYVAVPVASSGVVHGALRVTLDAGFVTSRVHRFWFALGAVGATVLATMGLVGFAIARSVTQPLRELEGVAKRYADGDLSTPRQPVVGPPEIRTLDQAMSSMATQLDAQIEQQRRFVADASHQLRTPLTALRLQLENLHARVDDEAAEALDSAIDETTRLASLVSDLLQLARVEQRRELVTVDLRSLVEERAEIWSAVADERSVRLVVVGAAEPAAALAVPGAVEQILDNVIDNAVAVSPPGGMIELAVGPAGSGWVVSVTDQGPGLDDDAKRAATERFWRGSTMTPGTGLGLAIADALADASSGRLVLTDSPNGAGLQVRVELLRA